MSEARGLINSRLKKFDYAVGKVQMVYTAKFYVRIKTEIKANQKIVMKSYVIPRIPTNRIPFYFVSHISQLAAPEPFKIKE